LRIWQRGAALADQVPSPTSKPKGGSEAAGFEVVCLAGIPERTYLRRLAGLRAGDPFKGPRPAPVVDHIEALAAKYLEAWPAWGYREIAALIAPTGTQ
jgi:hypothetical protein